MSAWEICDRSVTRELHILEWILLISPFLLGGFFPWSSVLISTALATLLIRLLMRNSLYGTRSPVFIFGIAIVVFLLSGLLWGTDRGMAPVGAVQFLPLPLFILLIEQYDLEQRIGLFHRIPYAASLMVVLSLLLSQIHPLENWFLVAERQAGFFQYPNTYAIYLLFAVVLVLFGDLLVFGPLPWLIILIVGIVLSGSRIVFVLLIVILTIYVFWEKSGKPRLVVLGLIFATIVGSTLYVILTGNRSNIGRFLTISLTSSEFVGRLLYTRDVIPVILKHPLGIGYTGFRWLQGSFQTGVYSVRYVHNDFLQLLLDAGWIPAGLFFWSLIRSIRSRKGGICRKLLLAVLLFHMLLDFDMQFVSVALLLSLLLDVEPRADRPIKARVLHISVLTVLLLFSAWIGVSSFLYYIGNSKSSAKLYHGYTPALVDLLPNADQENLESLTDQILRYNKSVALAHDAKARIEFSHGRFSAMQEHKLEAIRLAKYNLEEYLDYFAFLRYSYNLYTQRGDQSSAEYCRKEIMRIPSMLKTVTEQTSRLGWLIFEKPELELPEDLVSWIDEHLPGADNSEAQ